jgi:cell division control protein 24
LANIQEEGFEVYEPFCANFAYANELALEETKNGTLGQLSNLDDPQHQFGSLLIKPVQRICKYPLLLKQLLRYTDQTENPHLYAELEAGIASIERVTNRVNETKREQENISIQRELETRIVNWKEIELRKLGNLLLNETFPVLMGEKERTFQCYLFQKMLMCCRDDSLTGRDSKKATKTMSMSKKSKNGKTVRESSVPAKGPLHIKGRLYIRDIRDIYIPQDRSTGIILSDSHAY